MTKERVVFLDWLRVIACFLVIMTHCNEMFYLGGEEIRTQISSATDAFWTTFFISLCRCCVPLFVLASSYLLFPLEYDTRTFFRKRAIRIVIPATLWLVIYCIFCGNPAGDFRQLPFNFPMCAAHIWFCYMIVGLYLLMPLLSPWAEKAGKKELQIFLGIWLFTTLIPAFRQFNMDINGSWAFWGEQNWTEFGTFYYVSGYIGYLVLGLYFRKYVGELSWRRTLLFALPLFAAGFAISAAWFYGHMPKTFPVDDPNETAVHMEVMHRYCSISVVMMTVAAFLVIRKVRSSGRLYRHVVLPVSKASYGLYLMHILTLAPLFSFWQGIIGTAGFWATPATVVCTAISVFAVCALISVLLQKIPKAGKYIVG